MKVQEAFDAALNGVLAQGGPSMHRGICMYRNWDGKRCAIGHILKDKLPENSPIWDRWLNIQSLSSYLRRNVNSNDLNVLFKQHENLLLKLQMAHDAPAKDGLVGQEYLDNFVVRMKAIAESWELKFDHS